MAITKLSINQIEQLINSYFCKMIAAIHAYSSSCLAPFPVTSNAERILIRVLKLSTLKVRQHCRGIVLFTCKIAFGYNGLETVFLVHRELRVGL